MERNDMPQRLERRREYDRLRDRREYVRKWTPKGRADRRYLTTREHDRIKAALDYGELSMAEIARQLGHSYRTIANIKYGKTRPRFES